MTLMIYRAVTFLFVLGVAIRGQAQGTSMQRRVDSLKKILITANGAERFDALYGLAYEYSDEIDSLSLIYAVEAYDLAMKLGDSIRIIQGGRIKSAQLRRLERFDQAIQVGQRILSIAKRHTYLSEVKSLLNSLANSHFLKAEYDKALKYHFESLVLREKDGDKAEISISLSNIGVVYYKLGDFSRAIEYNKKSLELKKQANDIFDLDRLFINLGLCFNSIGDYNEAKKYINEGLRVRGEKCTDRIVLEGEFALGVSLFETKSIEESLEHFERSYAVANRLGNYRFQVENLICFARVYLIMDDFKLVRKYLTEAEKISINKGYRFLQISVYDLFTQLFEKSNDYENIAFYQSKYIKLKDSILSEEVISNLSQLRTDYVERENVKTIAEKNQILSLQTQLLEKRKLQTYSTALIVVLLLILTVLIYRSYREKLSINVKLDKKVKERTEELREANGSLAKANELRESRISKVIQDTQNRINSIRSLCRVAQRDLLDEDAKEYLRRIEDNADKIIAQLSKQPIEEVPHH